MILLKNCKYLSPEGIFVIGDLAIDDAEIVDPGIINTPVEPVVIDLNGLMVVPGFIDIHFHGAMGYDIMDASLEEFKKISDYLINGGTTSFLATTITSPKQELSDTIKKIRCASQESDGKYSSILGVHVEGPYINRVKKGCHRADWMRCPSTEELGELRENLGPDLKIHMTLAPEIEGAMEFIKYAVQKGVSISIGHSNATAEITYESIANGANCFTHLFNAMKGIDHREPGVAGAALNSDSFVELICDGVHVHPDMINIVYRLKGKDQIILITDAMKAAGLGDGTYEFGGFKVIVDKGVARKEDGTLASSTLTMLDAVKNMVMFTKISLEEAILMATRNPAQAIGVYDKVGSIEIGKRADLVILDENLNVVEVICGGKTRG